MATTHIYNKLQDTSIYINLSSQNLHSAIAALKQEAKPLTTLNIKGFGDTKRGSKRQGNRQENEAKMMMRRDEDRWEMARQRDGFLSELQRLFGFVKRGCEFDDICKHLNVNDSAPRGRYGHFKMQVQFLHLVKKKKKMSMTVKQS